MRISKVTDEVKKKSFSIEVGEQHYSFPYAKLSLEPTPENPVVEVFADPELGEEAFTYRLRSGEEDTIHLDAVLEVNKDPHYLQELLLHRLTVEARKGVEESGLGKRQLARLLGTSPSQLYRLLDPENSQKSVGQMLALLHLVDRRVDLTVYAKSSRHRQSSGKFEVYLDKRGSYRFRLRAASGEVILSSEGYRSKDTCRTAIGKVRELAVHESSLERKTTEGGRFEFRIKEKDLHVIARSPAFTSAAKRDRALATVRKKASNLEVEEIGLTADDT